MPIWDFTREVGRSGRSFSIAGQRAIVRVFSFAGVCRMVWRRIARVWTIGILVFQLGTEIRITALSIARLRAITRLGFCFGRLYPSFEGRIEMRFIRV